MLCNARGTGTTVIELVILLSVLTIIGTAALALRGGSSAHRDAASLARALTSARWLAVATAQQTALFAREEAIFVARGTPLGCDTESAGA